MSGFRTASSGGSRPAGDFAGPATGASPFNQAQILHLMKTEFARSRRYGFSLACVLMQVDRLRALTDIHGTQLKESVQAEFCRLVAEGTRGADQLGLISDDRYLLVLPHTAEEEAVVVAQRMRRDFSQLEVKSRGSVLDLTLSLGVVSCADKDTLFFDTLLSRAETAMGWAQQSGGDRVEIYRAERE